MKSALYTIFRCTNYGAVLQAVALARTMRSVLGEDAVDVLNHRMDPRDTHLLGKITNPNTPWFQRWRNKRKFAARYFRPDLFEVRRAKTVELIGRAIRPTERLYRSPEALKDIPPYSTVVVGSDQVWNPVLNHDFGRNQYLAVTLPDRQDRVAYAASFGVSDLPDASLDEYAAALRRFREITVREETGAAICESLIGKRPEVVLDPTMLLTADEWRSAARSAADGPQGRYVAAYWVRTVTPQDVTSLSRVSRMVGAPIRLMSAGPLPKLEFPENVIPFVDADPFDFVAAVAKSEAVVTDSFHGLQFSTLFAKPFVALGNLTDPKSNASRLIDFCARYGLVGGVKDIEDFRSGVESPFADLSGLSNVALSNDRDRSLCALKRLIDENRGIQG